MSEAQPAAPDAARPDVPALGPRALAFLVGSGAIFALYSFGYDLWKLPPQVVAFGPFGRTLVGDVLPMLVAPLLAARFVLGIPLAAVGVRARPVGPMLRAALLAWLAVLPVAAWLAFQPAVREFYPSPHFPPAREHAVGLVVLWAVLHAPQLASVELLYRGYLLQPLARRFGFERAAAFVVAPYVLLHWTKPAPELWLAAWGGLAFSWAAWRTRSFWPGFLAHWLTAVTVDALCFVQLR